MKHKFNLIICLLIVGSGYSKSQEVALTEADTEFTVIEFEINQPESLVADVQIHPLTNNTWQLNVLTEGGTPSYSYLWTPSNGLSNPKIANPILAADHAQSYTLKVTDSKGCSVSIAYSTVGLDIKNAKANNDQFQIYVDNSSENLQISFSEHTIYAIVSLYDVQGQRLKTLRFDDIDAGDVLQESVGDLAAGVYLVNIETPTQQLSTKIFKK